MDVYKLHAWLDGSVKRLMAVGCMDEWMDESMDRWMTEQMDAWVDVSTVGWMVT